MKKYQNPSRHFLGRPGSGAIKKVKKAPAKGYFLLLPKC
jgi:hypothetical protein